jgi:2-methylcitrate dehydratase PrpD
MREIGELSEFVAGCSYESLPDEVVEQARLLSLDFVAASWLGARSEVAPLLRAVYLDGSAGGSSRVLGAGGKRAPAPVAAGLNAAFAHQVELAEGVSRAVVHCSNSVVPSAIAMAEQLHANGAEYLRAVALGCETIIRFGLMLANDPAAAVAGDNPVAYRRGWWTPAMLAPIGAATAATLLHGGDAVALRNAWGTAVNVCPTTTRALVHEGGSAKGFAFGIGCMSGVASGSLAARGVSGLVDIVGGWATLLADARDIRLLSRGLGSRFEMLDVLYKWFATVGPLFAPLEAVFAITAELGKLDPRQIESIDVRGYRRTVEFLRSSPAATPEEARSDLGYCLAQAIVANSRGSLLEAAFEPEALNDPVCRDLASRVHAEEEATYQAEYPLRSATADVTIQFRDGSTVTKKVDRDQISRYHFPTRREVAEKFAAVAQPTLDEEGALAAADAFWGLPGGGGPSELLAPLCGH